MADIQGARDLWGEAQDPEGLEETQRREGREDIQCQEDLEETQHLDPEADTQARWGAARKTC